MSRKSHSCYVVCPYCGYEHGDAWECCNQTYPKDFLCNGCEREFECWAEYDVTYHAETKDGQSSSGPAQPSDTPSR
jgi:hypothetical protein